MHLYKILIPLLITVPLITAVSDGIRVEELKPEEETSGCGYGYYLGFKGKEDQREVFAESNIPEKDGSSLGLIRVNGELHRLRKLSHKEIPKNQGKCKVGDKFTEVWSDGKVKLTFICIVSELLYEETDYQGDMTVEVGKERKSFKVRGFKGC